MQIRNTILLAASAALACAEDVYLVVKSDNTEINGDTLGFPHEGAGINYVFLGSSSQSEALTYDSEYKELTYSSGTIYPYVFGISGNFVAVSVMGANGEYTFDGNTLAVNGTTDAFYACKNTGDPYDYSTESYELMYYKEDAPSDCIALTLEKEDGSSSSSSASASAAPSSTSLSTSTTSSSSSSTSSAAPSASNTYEDAAIQNAPGALAFFAGAAFALI